MRAVVITFPTEKAAKDFMEWMSNSGEQDYFEEKEYNPEAEVVDNFTYDLEGLKMYGSGNRNLNLNESNEQESSQQGSSSF